jgi:transcriptional regulator with XRE-family HTH domain
MSAAIGERLRAARKAVHLSLHDVEAKTAGEFKAASLGTYERGERSISVDRLQRLAEVYGLDAAAFLSDDAGGVDAPRSRVVIDLTKMHEVSGPERDLVVRFVSQMQARRQDFGGRTFSMRGDDLITIACLGVTPARLAEIGLLA